jgi:hypothetical protein
MTRSQGQIYIVDHSANTGVNPSSDPTGAVNFWSVADWIAGTPSLLG